MTVLWLSALFALFIIATVCVINTLSFPRLRPGSIICTRRASVLIPARDEAHVISETVSRLLRQDHPDYEIILLDDGSTDGTSARAVEAAAGDPRLRVVAGEPLPPGWLGKNWACHQLAREATGEILVFADADVRWEPTALSAILHLMDKTRADTFTVWPTQHTWTWGERLVVPMMSLAIMGYLPEICVRYVPWPVFAAANGQCLAFRRKTYEEIGGHQEVGSNVIEDIALAWETKRQGFKLVMADGNLLINTRMYHSWPEVRDGFAKNILAGHGNRPVFLMLSAAFHWLIFLAPWVWLALGWGIHLGPVWPWFPLTLIGLGVSVRALSAAATHQRIADSILLPISTILMTAIAARSLWWQFRYGGGQWKGRLVTHRT